MGMCISQQLILLLFLPLSLFMLHPSVRRVESTVCVMVLKKTILHSPGRAGPVGRFLNYFGLVFLSSPIHPFTLFLFLYIYLFVVIFWAASVYSLGRFFTDGLPAENTNRKTMDAHLRSEGSFK